MLKNISEPQLELFNILKRVFPDAELELKIGGRVNKKGYNVKWADIGIPSLNIDFEYDGFYHEITPLKDKRRDEELMAQGWTVFRITKDELWSLDAFSKSTNKIEFIEFVQKLLTRKGTKCS